MDDIMQQIQNGIYKGDTNYVIDRTELALRYGISLEEIMKDALFPPMKVMGEKLRTHEIFIPDVLKASRAMHAALYVLRPIISHSSSAPLLYPVLYCRGYFITGHHICDPYSPHSENTIS